MDVVETNIVLTDKEKEIIERLGHSLFTVEFIEQWINRKDTVVVNAVAALQICEVHGFYEAVHRMAQIES